MSMAREPVRVSSASTPLQTSCNGAREPFADASLAPPDRTPGSRKDQQKGVLCRGPESNWRHMVLQVMFLAICEFAPGHTGDDTWLWATTNCSTEGRRAGGFHPESRSKSPSHAANGA